MSLLEGTSLLPLRAKAARALVGKRVCYLRRRDIDRSGRGYYFPRSGFVDSVLGRNIEIDGNYVYFGDLVEMVLEEGA